MGTITGPTSSELIDVNRSEQLLDAEKAQSKLVISISTEFIHSTESKEGWSYFLLPPLSRKHIFSRRLLPLGLFCQKAAPALSRWVFLAGD